VSGAPLTSPWGELVRVYLALPAPDPAARIHRLLQAAEVWARGAGDIERAFDALVDASLIDIEDPDLQQRVGDLAAEHDRFDRMLQLYLDGIERAADAGSLIRLHLKVSELLLAHGQQPEAEHHLASVLAVQPQNVEAAHRLQELYRADERWQELAELQDRQLEALSDRLDRSERIARLQELTDLYQHTLQRPFETVDFLTRLAAEAPEDRAVQLRLADLYEELSIWPRLIEVLEGLLGRDPEPRDRIELLLRMGRTFEEELELPDRSIESFQAVLAEQPDNGAALLALDRLYETHHRAEELIEVLRLRAELAEGEPANQRALLLRLARVLELQGPEGVAEALQCLQRAREAGPFDADLEEALARALVGAGRPAEAVALIHAQVDAARQEGTAERVAALLIRLARVQLENLGDAAAAQQALEDAAAAQPSSREVQQALCDFFRQREDSPRLAGALARLAELDPAHPEAVGLLLQAAWVQRDRLGELDAAAHLLERVLELEPANLPAIEALLELVEDDLERREALLRLKLELTPGGPERAALLAELGRVLRRRGAPDEAAAALLQEALSMDSDCLVALDGLSEILVGRGDLQAAQILLEGAIERAALENRRSLALGPLYQRLGVVFEALGRDEDGHRYLQEALRLDPTNLLLRVAIGMNRFRGGHWRDALRSLQDIGDDPGAATHPELIAEALYTAGRCEAMLRRGDRAVSWYEAALARAPGHRGALAELTQAAVAASDWRRAAQLLERQLDLPGEPPDRPALLRQLAELYHDHLEDNEAAARWFVELFDHLGEDEATRLEVLPRMLPVLRKAERHRTAARAAEALAQLLDSRTEIRDLLLAAAQEYVAGGEPEPAERHLKAVLSLDPHCFDAAETLTRLLEGSGRAPEVVPLLREFLADQLEPEAPDARAQLARLYAELGRVLQGIGDRRAAIAVLERSLELAESVPVRETLAELYGGDSEHSAAELANHRQLLRSSPGRSASLRALARAAAPASPYRAFCLYQALEALGELDPEAEAFLAGYAAPALEAEAPYPGELGEDDRQAMLASPDVHGLDEVFALLWEAAPALLSKSLADYGVGPGDRVSPIADSELAHVFSACSRALAIKQTALYTRTAEGGAGITIVGMAPPAVIVDAHLAENRSAGELRFLLGRALELTHPAYILAAGLDRGEFARLLSSVLRAFHPRHMRGRRDLGEAAVEQANHLRKAMPFKIARRLGEIFRQQVNLQFDSGRWRQAVIRSANRAGLVLCGDLGLALRLVIEDDLTLAASPLEELLRTSPVIRDLVTFAVSDAFYVARVKLGLAGAG